MNRSFRHAVPMLGVLAPALVAISAPAAAQQAKPAAAPTCDVDQNKPASLAQAVFTVTRVQSTTDTAAKHKALREVIGKVSGDAKAAKDNPIGTAFTLAQAYSILAQDVGLANGATRAGLGLSGSEPVDLLKLVDEQVKIVEAAKPACAENVAQLRQFAWLNTMNAALNALNAQKMDSAAFYAQRSLIAYDKSPLAYYVLSTAAQSKGDLKTAAGYWPQILKATEGDTSQTAKELRTSTMYNMAATASQEAETLQGDAQKTRAREAAQAVKTFLDAYPQYPDAPRLQATLARMLTLSGDTQAVSSVYQSMLADPSKHSDLALTQAGVIASQAGKHEDAAKLFAAALDQSRYQRDALNNLAATYMQLKQYEPMLPIAQRLLEVDPANPDNYLFVALAYQGLSSASKNPKVKAALTDSLLKYNKMGNDMPVKVSFTEFTRGDTKSTLVMTVEGVAQTASGAKTAAGAKAAAAAPKSYTLHFEFLDKAGTVLDTQDVTVGTLGAGQKKPSKVEIAKPGVAAFRYKLQS